MAPIKEKFHDSVPFLGKLTGATLGYCAGQAVGLGPLGAYIGAQLGNLDLWGEEVTRWLEGPERNARRHLKNKDIHAVLGRTLVAILEEHINSSEETVIDAETSVVLLEGVGRAKQRWADLDPAQLPELAYLQGRDIAAIYKNGPKALYEPQPDDAPAWETLLFLLMPLDPESQSEVEREHLPTLAGVLAEKFPAAFTYQLRHDEAAFRGVMQFLLSELLRQTGEMHADLQVLLKPQPRLTHFERAAKEDVYSAYLFRHRVAKVVGRERACDALRKFVDSPEPFLWARLTGNGGTGKSRLALELAERFSRVECWHAGFVDSKAAPFDWDNWQPALPTILVLDYAMSRRFGERDTGELLDLLQEKLENSPVPVRVLLLDRDSDRDGWFWDRLVTNVSNKAQVYACEFVPESPEDLNLLGLPNVLAVSVLAGELKRLRELPEAVRLTPKAFTEAELQGIVTRLEARLREPVRPLFALFAARALAEGVTEEEWSAEGVTEVVLKQERIRWDRYAQEKGLDAAHLNLLFLATLTGGIAPETEGAHLPGPNFNEDALSLACSLSGGYVPDRNVPALLPDLLGELFILERLSGTLKLDAKLEPNARQVQVQSKAILQEAWRLNPSETSRLIELAFLDFRFGHRTYPQFQAAFTALGEKPEAPLAELLWQFQIAPRLAFEYAGRGEVETARPFSKTSEPALVAFARGLYNATFSASSVLEAAPYLAELRELALKHGENAEIQIELAKGLTNATFRASSVLEAAPYLAELRELVLKHGENVAILNRLFRATTIVSLKPQTDDEWQQWPGELELLAQRLAELPEAREEWFEFIGLVLGGYRETKTGHLFSQWFENSSQA